MPPPLYASTTLAGKPWSRCSAELLLGRWSSWVGGAPVGHRWSTTVPVLRRCIETTGIGACTARGAVLMRASPSWAPSPTRPEASGWSVQRKCRYDLQSGVATHRTMRIG